MEPVQPTFATIEHDGFVLEDAANSGDATGAALLALIAGAFSLIGLFASGGNGEVVGVSLVFCVVFAMLALQAFKRRRLRVTFEEIIIEEGVARVRSIDRFRLAETEVGSVSRRDNAGSTIRELLLRADGRRLVFQLPRVKAGDQQTAAAELLWCVRAIEAAKARVHDSSEEDREAMHAALNGVPRSTLRE